MNNFINNDSLIFINNDSLIRIKTIRNRDGITIHENHLVITKEEFIACYNKWVKEENDPKMTTNKAIKILQSIEEDGRNVNREHIEALNLAVKAFEFIEENVPSTFDDYIKGKPIE